MFDLKRCIAVLIVMSLCFALVACGENEPPESAPVESNEESTPKESAPSSSAVTDPEPETELSRLEKRIAQEYKLENFKLVRIFVDTIDDPTHSESMLNVSGVYGEENEKKNWSKTFEITYGYFTAFYSVNNYYVVYNTGPSDFDDMTVTDAPEWVFETTYRVLFEQDAD